MRSLAVGIALTWIMALFAAIVIAYMSAWPIGLFNGGDPAAGWVTGFLLGGLGAGWWAARTTRSLVRDHASDGDTFRRPWPLHANVEALVEQRLLDRRRQPGHESSWGDDLIADLRSGERSERMLVVDTPVVLHVAFDGPEGACTRLVEVDTGAELLRIERDPGWMRVQVAAGRWRLVLERPGLHDGRRVETHAWWVAEAPARDT